jgi:asparagine synthase (glutamine-hydrolysing)
VCGICGFAGEADARPLPEVLDRMCASIAHRGPDDQGVRIAEGVALGSRRLSIIDIAGGNQPIRNEDGTLWIVFNGEIYNYPELRPELISLGHEMYTHSDTECVLHAYEQWGEDFLSHLNGMFGLAIWDVRRRVLTLARDRMGIKPMYYTRLGRQLVFGSELKALLAHPGVPRDIDHAAVAQYLSLEYVPSPRSILKGVDKLPPGHVLRWRQSDGGIEMKKWWDVELESSEGVKEPDLDSCAADLRAALKEAVRKELVADVPIGVFLSGGIDSSAVAATMAELAPGNVNSFSIGFADRSFDESAWARMVATRLGTNHHELVLEPHMLFDLVPKITALLDEPMADASIIPTYLLSQFTRQHVKVALGGDGGDELFAGYPTVLAHRLAGYYNQLPGVLSRRLVPGLVGRLPVNHDNLSFDYRAKRFVGSAHMDVADRHRRWMGSFTPEEVGSVLAPGVLAAAGSARDPVIEHLGRRAFREPLNQVLYLDMKLYLENDILTKVDRASMMVSLEARVPLLNVDFVEHVARLPLSLKLRRFNQKFIFKRALRGLVPPEILARPKKGFGIPVARWFRGPLRELLVDTLSPTGMARHGLFQAPEVERLIRAHLEGTRDHRKELWTLFIFQRWFDTWVAGGGAAAESPMGSRRTA